jgi:hypothetical protein
VVIGYWRTSQFFGNFELNPAEIVDVPNFAKHPVTSNIVDAVLTGFFEPEHNVHPSNPTNYIYATRKAAQQ